MPDWLWAMARLSAQQQLIGFDIPHLALHLSNARFGLLDRAQHLLLARQQPVELFLVALHFGTDSSNALSETWSQIRAACGGPTRALTFFKVFLARFTSFLLQTLLVRGTSHFFRHQ